MLDFNELLETMTIKEKTWGHSCTIDMNEAYDKAGIDPNEHTYEHLPRLIVVDLVRVGGGPNYAPEVYVQSDRQMAPSAITRISKTWEEADADTPIAHFQSLISAINEIGPCDEKYQITGLDYEKLTAKATELLNQN